MFIYLEAREGGNKREREKEREEDKYNKEYNTKAVSAASMKLHTYICIYVRVTFN